MVFKWLIFQDGIQTTNREQLLSWACVSEASSLDAAAGVTDTVATVPSRHKYQEESESETSPQAKRHKSSLHVISLHFFDYFHFFDNLTSLTIFASWTITIFTYLNIFISLIFSLI